jgi:hypothetical protein
MQLMQEKNRYASLEKHTPDRMSFY